MFCCLEKKQLSPKCTDFRANFLGQHNEKFRNRKKPPRQLLPAPLDVPEKTDGSAGSHSLQGSFHSFILWACTTFPLLSPGNS